MKKTSFILLIISILAMVSCSSTDDNLRAMIPDDAVGVMTIDLDQVISKAGMLKGDTVDEYGIGKRL